MGSVAKLGVVMARQWCQLPGIPWSSEMTVTVIHLRRLKGGSKVQISQ